MDEHNPKIVGKCLIRTLIVLVYLSILRLCTLLLHSLTLSWPSSLVVASAWKVLVLELLTCWNPRLVSGLSIKCLSGTLEYYSVWLQISNDLIKYHTWGRFTSVHITNYAFCGLTLGCHKGKKDLTLDTPTSVCIFSVLFFIHFRRCWQEEFVYQSKAFFIDDSFFYSRDINLWFRGDIVGRN